MEKENNYAAQLCILLNSIFEAGEWKWIKHSSNISTKLKMFLLEMYAFDM